MQLSSTCEWDFNHINVTKAMNVRGMIGQMGPDLDNKQQINTNVFSSF